MIVCDKCKKPLEKHHVVEFGYVGTVWEKNPNWDLCEECEKETLEELKDIIENEEKNRKYDIKTYAIAGEMARRLIMVEDEIQRCYAPSCKEMGEEFLKHIKEEP